MQSPREILTTQYWYSFIAALPFTCRPPLPAPPTQFGINADAGEVEFHLCNPRIDLPDAHLVPHTTLSVGDKNDEPDTLSPGEQLRVKARQENQLQWDTCLLVDCAMGKKVQGMLFYCCY